MTQRWGSYSAKNKLVLNRDLIRASIQSIDYVIAHELAHALEPDHGARWQALMNSLLPDWQRRKSELEARPASSLPPLPALQVPVASRSPRKPVEYPKQLHNLHTSLSWSLQEPLHKLAQFLSSAILFW